MASLREILEGLVEKHGRQGVLAALRDVAEDDADVLTIVSNRGLHKPPEEYLFGEVYWLTEGPMQFTTTSEVQDFLNEKMRELRLKLVEKRWKEIYLLPFGHVILNMHIKMTVFRTLYMDTVDIFYFGNNRYDLLRRDTRSSLLEGGGK